MSVTQARIRNLVEELIEQVTGLSPEDDLENFNLCRQYATKALKAHNLARTNQFDVLSQLSGLEEKFRVYNNELLADALSSRLEELPSKTSGVIPEILSLLLNLSDRPLQNTRLADLEQLIEPETPKELTWEDILREEPLQGEEWANVDFGAESSDAWTEDGEESIEEVVAVEEPRKRRKRRGKSESDEEEVRVGVEAFLVEGDKDGLEKLKGAQYWCERVVPVEKEVDVSLGSGGVDDLWIVSEVQAVREVLFMLLGYPCVLFELGREADGEKDNAVVWIDTRKLEKRFALRHASLDMFIAALEWFAEKGTGLNRIREFARTREDVPEKQAFVAAVEEKLVELDKVLVDLQEQFVGEGSEQLVSLLSLQHSLSPHLRPFSNLSRIISTLPSPHSPLPPATLASQHLDSLFTTACALQSLNDIPSFNFIAIIFFSSLQTYLRPILEWMGSGELRKNSTFLVSRKPRSRSTLDDDDEEEIDLGNLWSGVYELRCDEDDELLAPEFVKRAAGRIFVTGKSVVFLRHLVDYDAPDVATLSTVTPRMELDFATVFPDDEEHGLAPFAEVFGAAFERWIGNRHTQVSRMLRDVLYNNCGLWRSLEAIEYVFLCKNGFLFENLAKKVFEKVDRGVETWGDRFLLTEMVQGVFAGVGVVEVERLRMKAKQGGDRRERRGVGVLVGVEVEYALPWPVMNVIQKTSFQVYKAIFTFLLQIRRARYVLERLVLLKEDFRVVGEEPDGSLYYLLKQRLLWFVNVIYHYLTDLVLLPQSSKMKKNMSRAVDMDGMIEVHRRYVAKIREQCLLASRLAPIHTAILQILDLSIAFSDLHLSYADELLGDKSTKDVDILIGSASARRRRRSRSRRRKRMRGEVVEDSESEEEEEEEEEGKDEGEEDGGVYGERVKAMMGTLEGLVGFVKSGLRGVARAGVMPHLEGLAEELEGVGWGGGGVGDRY
ncbi:hypothetical protein RUND412_000762 [Rhizina undulata]